MDLFESEIKDNINDIYKFEKDNKITKIYGNKNNYIIETIEDDSKENEDEKNIEIDLSRRNIIEPNIISLNLVDDHKRIKFDMSRSALMIIDMQNFFCDDLGYKARFGYDLSLAKELISPINNSINIFRNSNSPVIWVNWGNRKDMLNLPSGLLNNFQRAIINENNETEDVIVKSDNNNEEETYQKSKTSPFLTNDETDFESKIIKDLDFQKNDIYINKYRVSGFYNTSLEMILRNIGVQSLFIAGVNLDQCVMTTLQDANYRGFDCILLKDCSTTSSPQCCFDATYYNINRCYGYISDSQKLSEAVDQ
eukprot:TRINITY_DN16483_c0_g1_i1.p1 TRINITY_DN16483_c0_g1~~TRINITY_DN16483_c0_g1_i1.p1  ORF type:complete len:309 (+),score=84.64 TRINITY_DN16483_c0_g1_i1:53-979(+)